jgi:hypothetical protein
MVLLHYGRASSKLSLFEADEREGHAAIGKVLALEDVASKARST